ncbi:MAG: hypothetical protein IS860_11620, partial [Nitrosopumilus sp.]|nr:hypothetical protein [Nitrosopumilus sp.]
RTGWEIISKVSTVTSEQPTILEFNTASTLEFVDDGREYPQALQRAPAPHIVYDKIIASELNPNNIDSAKSLSFESVPHEKFSYTPGAGFHVEDFMPSYIPDGQKLLYAENMCFESGTCWLTIQFVPNNFEFDTRTTNHDIQVSKGFKIFAEYDVEGVDQVEDIVETLMDMRSDRPRQYGGFVDMDFGDEKEGFAFEGGDALNHYRSTIYQHLDEYSGFAVISYYHTYDEILPIFKSIVN